MEERKTSEFGDVLDSEMDDLWDIFFPYMSDEKDQLREVDFADHRKPRKYLNFLTM